MIYRWNTINPNENASAEITDAGRNWAIAEDRLTDEVVALRLTPLAKIELDASWLDDAAARRFGGELAWMG